MPIASAGRRRGLVTIQGAPATEPGGEYPVETFTDLPPAVRMLKTPVMPFDGGAEAFKADQLSARLYEAFESPYRADLDPDLVDVPKRRRLVYSGRVFDIVQADVIGQRQGIRLVTRATSGR